MSETEVNVDDLVATYLEIREARAALLHKYEEEDAELKNELRLIEIHMLDTCAKINVDSLKTKKGLVMRKLNERFFCNDWGGFDSFVLEHKAPELFERRIHQGNMKEFLSQHPDSGRPPGVEVMREFKITVRKAKAGE